jgi:hypothetical protein
MLTRDLRISRREKEDPGLWRHIVLHVTTIRFGGAYRLHLQAIREKNIRRLMVVSWNILIEGKAIDYTAT